MLGEFKGGFDRALSSIQDGEHLDILSGSKPLLVPSSKDPHTAIPILALSRTHA